MEFKARIKMDEHDQPNHLCNSRNINCNHLSTNGRYWWHYGDVTPFAAPVLMRAGG